MGRSRGGCITCKRRKRKCDETRPACLACRKRPGGCEGYAVRFRWDVGIASRGRFTGMSAPTEESPSPKQDTLRDGHVEKRIAQSLMDDDVQQAFSEFLNSGYQCLFSSKTEDRSYLTRYMEESEAIVHVCVALQLSQDASQFERFHQSFHKAVETVRVELLQNQSVLNRGTLGASLLLCTLSINQAIPWTRNLICLADLYDLHGDLSRLDPSTDSYTHHLFEVMGVMDLPTMVLGRVTPYLGIWRRFRQAQASWDNSIVSGVEPVSGAPRTLLDILARTDELRVEEDLWLWPGEVGELLQAHLWESWRCAGMLAARRQKHNQAHAGVISGAATRSGGLIPLPNTETLLYRLISSLDALKTGVGRPENQHLLVTNGMLYPYVAACSEFQLLRCHPEWKEVLHEVRVQVCHSYGTKNCQVINDLIDGAWNRGESTFDPDEAARTAGVEIALF